MKKLLLGIVIISSLMFSACLKNVDEEDVKSEEKVIEIAEEDKDIIENTGAGKMPLTAEELKILDEIRQEYPKRATVTRETAIKRKYYSNPSKANIIAELKKAGAKYDIPYEVLYGIAYAESGLRQFKNGKPYISPDDGIGIMQVTPWAVSERFDRASLEYDWKYNIDAGTKVILGKWKWVSRSNPIGSGDPKILENWYLTIWAYNGYSYVNNPKEYAPHLLDSYGRRKFSNSRMTWYRYRPYQEDVIRFIKNELGVTLTSINKSSSNNYKLPRAGTRKVPIISSGVKFQTPSPYHYTNYSDKVNLQAIGGKELEYNEASGTYDMKLFVKNEKAGNSGEFSVTLWINGGVFRVDNLNIDGQKTIEVSIPTSIKASKEYSYSYLVDSRAQVNETDESDVDNKYSGKVKAMGQYNLRATGDVKAEKTENGTYDIYVGVSNEYLESISGYSVTLWINGGVFRVDNQSISGGSEIYHKLASNISKADIYDYAYLVDSRAQVKETTESDIDNKRSGKIKIGENIPDPEYKLSLEGVYEVTPNEYVEYRGELGAGISKVEGYIDGVQLRSLITNIEGNTYSIKFALNKRLGELRELKVVVVGKDGQTYTATKEIQMLGSELQLSYAKEVKLGEIVNFGGVCQGISEVEIKVDIYRISPVEKIKVVDGKFSYNYRFSGRGEDRKVYINGYNSAGKLVKTIEDTITVR